MFVLLTLSYDGLPIMYQGATIEELQCNLETDYPDWEEYTDFLANHMGIPSEEVISLWSVRPTGELEHVRCDIINKPRIVIAH